VEQTRTNQLTLEDLEGRPALRQRPSEAIDLVAEALLVIAIDAQRAELRIARRERVDVDREPEAVLRRSIGTAHVAPRVRRRERRLVEPERAQVPARLVE